MELPSMRSVKAEPRQYREHWRAPRLVEGVAILAVIPLHCTLCGSAAAQDRNVFWGIKDVLPDFFGGRERRGATVGRTSIGFGVALQVMGWSSRDILRGILRALRRSRASGEDEGEESGCASHRIFRLSVQMALDAAMVGARSTRIGMFAEAIAAISAYCGCPWGWRVGL